MGKRELLLIVGFLVLGVTVYQLTAPPDPEGRSRFNLGQLIDSVKREVQGNQASAEHRTETTEPLGPDIDELRLDNVPTVTLVGEDRLDLALDLTVVSTGFDEAEARALAEATVPRIDVSGRVATLSIDYPEGGRQTATLVVRVPSRLRARIRGARRDSRVSGVAAVELETTRGDVTIERIDGAVEGEHVGGSLHVTDAKAVSLVARSADLEIAGIAGETRLELTGGTARATRLGGGLEVTGRSAEIEADAVGAMARFDLRGGAVTLDHVSHEVRFDGRATDLTLALAVPAPVTAIASDADVRFTAPPKGGFALDATCTGGRLQVSGLDVAVTRENGTDRAAGDVAGGGPTVALRVTDGNVDVRGPAGG